MQEPFPEKMTAIAASMGIALYQRFNLNEAALFLRCSADSLQQLVNNNRLEYIQLTDDQVAFFGYQLLQHLLSSIKEISPRIPLPTEAERIIRSDEVQELTGLSRTTIWRMENKGDFPRRVPLGTGSVGWKLSEIKDWIKTR